MGLNLKTKPFLNTRFGRKNKVVESNSWSWSFNKFSLKIVGVDRLKMSGVETGHNL